jgi:predicted MPP superfamily phosphohydrolase
MAEFEKLAKEITGLISEWEGKLLSLPHDVITIRRNSQNRTIKQILGHMVDSASNNTHRVVHLQYRELPLRFPNYATYGNNDRWIAIQNYQDENWENLVLHWKFSNLHFAHVIQNINPETLQNLWISDVGEKITLKKMVENFMPHLILHLGEIEELAAPPQPSPRGRE